MDLQSAKQYLADGRGVLGIELGSTRIKAVLIDDTYAPMASGSHSWENRLENGIWTYTLDDIWSGLQDAVADLLADVRKQYDVALTRVAAIGISGMMHGYMAFNKEGELLVPFRTWRNTMTGQASEELTELFAYPIPQRWTIAHLYQAILKEEPHVKDLDFVTTLAGYLHWKLTGQKVVGIGEASGIFPIDIQAKDWNRTMLAQFDAKIADRGYPWKTADVLPHVLVAGDDAGTLTAEGAALLDPTGQLEAGIPLCPPEGDAGTGMAATNSVTPRTGNVSAGTSVFAMVVLEKELSRPHPEIDLVTTPAGDLVGMVHCNNCTSDLNAWVGLFRQFADLMGMPVDTNTLYTKLFETALDGEPDCGGLLSYNYLSGETITGFDEGRPLFVRTPDSHMSLSNFMRLHLYSALGALKVGLDILLKEEHVALDCIYGHGGYFKTPVVGQRMLAAAIDAPVSVMETAGEGGPWGMALLAAYRIRRKEGQSLQDFLASDVFHGNVGTTIAPDPADVAGCNRFIEAYRKGLGIEQAAVDALK